MTPPSSPPIALALVVVAPTVVGTVAAAAAARSSSAQRAWRAARTTPWAILGAAVVSSAAAADSVRANSWVRVDAVTAIVLSLVGLVGWVVVRFSARYLAGDPGERRAASRFAATLGAVAAVVVANDLALVALAWAATSLSLHGLLVHASDRPVAVAVAHKKVVLARVADVCMVGAIAAFAVGEGTTRLDQLAAGGATDGALSPTAHLGAVLVAAAVVLKCAQLPFHGWLIQVMEAPTPVSALLHAGVVNLGGVVLLRLAPVIDRAPTAQSVLVLVGATTAVVAALVMTTRVSVKVALAWSTCAQMGIMLVQCGLGLWELALVHLVAHSLYKAHAFLRAGSTVSATLRHRLMPPDAPPRPRDVGPALLGSAVVTGAVVLGWSAIPGTTSVTPAGTVFLGLVTLAGTHLTLALIRRPSAHLTGRVVLLPLAAVAMHEVAARFVAHGTTPPLALVVFAAAALATLFAAQIVIAIAPHRPTVVRMRRWLFHGGFVDEAFTRAVFSVWPPPSPAPGRSIHPTPAAHRGARPTLASELP